MNAAGSCFHKGGELQETEPYILCWISFSDSGSMLRKGGRRRDAARAAVDGKTKPGSCVPGARIYSPCLNNSGKQDAGPKI